MNPNDIPRAPLAIQADGWCQGAHHLPSPNFDQRPPPALIDLLVIHNISLPPGQFGGGEIAALFTNALDYDAHPYFEQLRPLRVSAHFLIDRSGRVTQFVAAGARAWHAGLSLFGQRERCNDFSIGVELEGTDFENFTDPQYAALAMLTCALEKAYPLTDVTGHQHIAPGRKTDPGPFFDWGRYRTEYASARQSGQQGQETPADGIPCGISNDGKSPAGDGLRFCI